MAVAAGPAAARGRGSIAARGELRWRGGRQQRHPRHTAPALPSSTARRAPLPVPVPYIHARSAARV